MHTGNMHTDTPLDDLTGSELRKHAAHKDEPISNTTAMVAGDEPMLVEASVVSRGKHLTAAAAPTAAVVTPAAAEAVTTEAATAPPAVAPSAAALPEEDMPELFPARFTEFQHSKDGINDQSVSASRGDRGGICRQGSTWERDEH